MKITDFLNAAAFRDAASNVDIVLSVIICAAFKISKVPSPSLANVESYKKIKNDKRFALVEAASNYLASEERHDRLQIVDDLFSLLDRRDFNVWMNKDSAVHFADFFNGDKSVLGSGDLAIRPLVEIVSRQSDHSERPLAEFCGYSEYARHIMSALSDVLELNIKVSDRTPWQRDWQKQFDLELCFPPLVYDVRNQKGISRDTLHLLGIDPDQGNKPRILAETIAFAEASTRAGSRVIITSSGGPLFRAVGSEKLVRESLVRSGRLTAVLKAPAKSIYANTTIDTYISVFDDTEMLKPQVGFTDLTLIQTAIPERYESLSWAHFANQTKDEAPHTRIVPVEEIQKANYVLLPDRYLQRDQEKALDHLFGMSEVKRLDEVANLIRAFALPKPSEGGSPVYEAAPADVGEDGFLQQPRKSREIDPASVGKVLNQKLLPNDIVLSIKGNVGTVGLVPDTSENKIPWVAGQSLMILRVKNAQALSPLTLFEYLANPTVNSYLRSLAKGATFPALNMKDIKQFPIAVPDKGFQADVETEFRHRQKRFQQIEDIRREIELDKQCTWPQSQID